MGLNIRLHQKTYLGSTLNQYTEFQLPDTTEEGICEKQNEKVRKAYKKQLFRGWERGSVQ